MRDRERDRPREERERGQRERDREKEWVFIAFFFRRRKGAKNKLLNSKKRTCMYTQKQTSRERIKLEF